MFIHEKEIFSKGVENFKEYFSLQNNLSKDSGLKVNEFAVSVSKIYGSN